jgi:hypothetical protein
MGAADHHGVFIVMSFIFEDIHEMFDILDKKFTCFFKLARKTGIENI